MSLAGWQVKSDNIAKQDMARGMTVLLLLVSLQATGHVLLGCTPVRLLPLCVQGRPV